MTDQIATGDIHLGEDFAQHRITGYVYHAHGKGIDPNLDVPLISHVEGNLWQGGCPDNFRVGLPDGFKHVVSLYQWGAPYARPQGCSYDVYTMYDSLDQATDQVHEIADKVAEYVKDGPTLVHCQAGLNRSGLIAAAALVKLGHEPAAAIKLLRDSRSPLVLVNEAFEQFVMGLG